MKQIRAILPVIAICAYSCLFIFFNNVGEGRFIEIIPPFIVFSIIGLVMLGIFNFIFRNVDKASIFSCLMMLLVINFNFVVQQVQNVTLKIRPLHILMIWLAIYAVIFIFLLKIKLKELHYVCNVISIIFIGLTVVNGIGALPSLFSEPSKDEISEVELEDRGNPERAVKNVYYFIFDEYGGTENLKHYYGFDNADFDNALTERGFSFSHSSYNIESYETTKVIPNLLNLSYVTSDTQTSNGNMLWAENPALYRYFREMGYQINLVNHLNFLDADGCNELLTNQKSMGSNSNFTEFLFEQSILSSIVRNVIPGNSFHEQYTSRLNEALEGMKNSWKYTDGKPTLTICYLQCPHVDFIYDENGNRLPEKERYNWENKNIYIGQLKYLNSWIEDSIDEIIENDPEAVIILQSDHGARYAYHCRNLYSDETYDADAEAKYMESVLNCVYWGEGVEAHNIEGLTCINTLRLVLNVEFDSHFKMLEYTGEK